MDIVDTLNGYSPDQLQHVARYAEALAEHRKRKIRLNERTDEEKSKSVRRMSRRRPRSRSRRSMIIATTTGSGEMENVFGPSGCVESP